MKGFFNYFENKGIKDIKDLTRFVYYFLQEPSIFFDLTEAESDGIKKN